jgi:hypothetical protein
LPGLVLAGWASGVLCIHPALTAVVEQALLER